MERVISLNFDDYKKSLLFAVELWYSGKSKIDWRSTGTKRDFGKYIHDHAMGKLFRNKLFFKKWKK